MSRKQISSFVELDNPSISVGSYTAHPSLQVRNLGVVFDQNMSFNAHATSVSKSAYFQLHNISRKRKSLTKDAAAACIHAFVTSKLDFCNALLYGLPKCTSGVFKKVQYAAARTLTCMKKTSRQHMTPVLKGLNWLPFNRRIEYKLLLVTYKAINGIGPDYIRELLEPYDPVGSLRSASDRYLLKEACQIENWW